MNFLSHYYHELPANDPYFIAGVIMPDILSNYSKRFGEKVRLNPSKLKKANTKFIESVSIGVQQHYIVDGFFHDSDYFDEMTDEIEQIIRKHDFNCFPRRLFAFSHVFLELMMDRVLLQNDLTLGDGLYGILEKVDEQNIKQYFEFQGLDSYASGIASHLLNFTNRKFLYHYLDDERFSSILEMINSGFGNPVFTNKDKNELKTVIYTFQEILRVKDFPIFTS